jgi:hypothetical protein
LWKGALLGGCVVGLAALLFFFGRDFISRLTDTSAAVAPSPARQPSVAELKKNAEPPVRPPEEVRKQPVNPPEAKKTPEPEPKKRPEPEPKKGVETRPPMPNPTPPVKEEGPAVKPPVKPPETPKVDIKPPVKPPEPPKVDVKPPVKQPDPPKPEVVVKQPPVKPPVKQPDPPKTEVVNKPPPVKPPAPSIDAYPRRALVVSVNNYLYANPLSYGSPQDKTYAGSSAYALLDYCNRVLHFPRTQLLELSDGSTIKAHAPLKPVIETTIADFLKASRAQDRVVLVFIGHAVETEKEAFLVPLEGDLENPETLIPLQWVYDRLKECKARQKVLIVDVCRHNPGRGQERPGGEAMGKVLDTQLQNPPPGVQVWSSCVLEQQSYEFENGGLFLNTLSTVLKQAKLDTVSPGDALPVEKLVPLVNQGMELVLKPQQRTQVSRLSGKEMDGAAYDPAEPLPEVVAIKAPPMAGGSASRAAVQSILDEITAVPPPRTSARKSAEILHVESLPAFNAKVLDEYKADYPSLADLRKTVEANPEQFPLRAAVLKASRALQENATKFALLETFKGAITPQAKTLILKEQEAPAKSILSLEEALDELKAAGAMRKKEPSKRWQAHYDYVMARLEARLVYLVEYNFVLAQIRGDNLPALENGATGYRVGSKKKVGVTENKVKDWVKDIKKTWDRLASQHPNTPWAVVALRERYTTLGLEWRATRE